jgi:hypothetical protein
MERLTPLEWGCSGRGQLEDSDARSAHRWARLNPADPGQGEKLGVEGAADGG